jgi:lipoate-protein ligase B
MAGLRAVKWVYVPHQVPYTLGLAIQEKLVHQRLAARSYLSEQPSVGGSNSTPSQRTQQAEAISRQDYLLLLEHTPVYTEGRRKGAKEAIGDDSEGKRLRGLGADYIVTQRGGLITYHGPGQLVGYPIWDIASMNLSTRCYVDKIQTSLHSLLNEGYHINTVPPPEEQTGVWADDMHKIVSIGIQVRQKITSHGFALNVHAQPLLTWFSNIVACGIKGKSMTSMERELALFIQREEEARPDREAASDSFERVEDQLTEEIEPGLKLGPESKLKMSEVVPRVVEHLARTYGREMQMATREDFRFEGDQKGILQRAWVAGEQVDHNGDV